jgi:prepilin-type N-terminal cleavage/methylation domain-containing protein
MKRYTRGFTLIELLVVIAIIGILSSVVLVSLNSARNKGVNTRIQEDAANLRTALETGYNNGNYGDLSTTGTAGIDAYSSGTNWATGGNLTLLRNDIITNEKGTMQIYDGGCTSGTSCTAYSIKVAWPGAASGGYCVDSTGYTNTYTTGGSAFQASSTCSTSSL